MTPYIAESTTDRYDTAIDRRKFAETLAEQLRNGDQSSELIQLARELAEDRDWQVRHEVAWLIPHLPAAELEWFADRLTSDSNAYVQRAACRTLEQRQRRDRETAQRRQKQTRITRQLQKLQSGKPHPMAKQVDRLCRQHGEELIGQIVHDLRCVSTRLTSAGADLIKNGPEEHAGARKIMAEQLVMLERLVDDWQRFSEPLHLDKRPESLRKTVDAAVRAARRGVAKCTVKASRVKVKVDMNSGIVVSMVRHMVEIALTNVIQNAFESFLVAGGKRPAGEIRVSAKTANGAVVLTVSDNGPGMNVEELKVISAFLPGRRNYAKPFSTGFGLAIAARNIAAHGGKLALTSYEEIGTQVTIDLPLDSKD